ncbi:MAG: response regulator [Spirochaetes bacterium]|nr:response regulator [Spirochaetota bacterium]
MVKTSSIALLLIGCVLSGCRGAGEVTPVIERGVLDVTTWDSEKYPSFRLEGTCEFYWMRFIYPEEFRVKKDLPEPSYVRIPTQWYKYTIDGEKLPPNGFATYRIVIKVKDRNMKLAMDIDQAATYRLFIDGKFVTEKGVVGTQKEGTEHYWGTEIVTFQPQGDEVELVFHVSNYRVYSGGMWVQILLGAEKEIITFKYFKIALEFFLIGSLLIMAIYHFILFLFGKRQREYLAFGILCLSAVLYTMSCGDLNFSYLVPAFGGMLLEHVSIFSPYMIFTALFAFIYTLFPIRPFKTMAYAVGVYSALFLAALIFFPLPWIQSDSNLLLLIIPGIFLIMFLCIMYYIIRNKFDNLYYFILGGAVFIPSAIFDMLAQDYLIDVYFITSPFGIFTLVISQALFMARRFSTTHSELDELTMSLEKKVEERTNELADKNAILEEMDQQKSNFFINLSHEIKTPLTLILNYMNVHIERHGVTDELDIIKRNIDKLLSDMINFFDVLKFERGINLYDHDTIIDLSEIMRQKVDLFQSMAYRSGITITTDIEPGLYTKADSLAVERIANNIIENAIRYNRENGTIEVALSSENDSIRLTVSDSGVGIDGKQLKHIFEPYFQISHDKRNIQGIGMGLSLVKSIVDSLEGRIEIKSEPSEGTAFSIILKRYRLREGDAVSRELLSVRPLDVSTRRGDIGGVDASVPGNYTVLVVEDNRDLLRLMHDRLRARYNVVAAVNGRDALDRLQGMDPPDVIISDVMMDEMDGYEFFDRITAVESLRDVPFIFLTAKSRVDDSIEGLRRGAIDYIYKPFVMEELISRIDSLLRYRELKKKVYEKDKYASLGMLLGGISHEIFNPLSGITGPMQNLRKTIEEAGIGNDGLIEKYLNQIEESVEKIEGIVGSIRILYSEKHLEKKPVPLSETVNGIVEQFKKNIHGSVEIETDLPPGLAIMANEEALAQILTNLIANAVDALDGEGRIIITARQSGESTVVTIEDNGRGIPGEELNKLFNAFYTTKEVNRGVGLGLNIVKNLVMKLGWDIDVTSEPGKGSTFTITARNHDERI